MFCYYIFIIYSGYLHERSTLQSIDYFLSDKIYIFITSESIHAFYWQPEWLIPISLTMKPKFRGGKTG